MGPPHHRRPHPVNHVGTGPAGVAPEPVATLVAVPLSPPSPRTPLGPVGTARRLASTPLEVARTPLAVGAAAGDRIRVALADEVARLLIGEREPVHHPVGPRADEGLFGPDSVTWHVHRDACLLVGGLRALLLQTLHPLAMAGVADHSRYRDDPLGRLSNTSLYVGTVIFGTTDEARQAVAGVKRVHERVTGTTPDGRPYAANDPHLLTWVHHTLVDSFLAAYRRYGGDRLTDDEADRYVAEWAVIADLFGAEPAARSTAELDAWFAAEQPHLWAGPRAHDAVGFLLAPPLPLHTRPAYAVLAAAAIDLLPDWARAHLGVPRLPLADRVVTRPSAWALLRTLDWVLAARPDPATDEAATTGEVEQVLPAR